MRSLAQRSAAARKIKSLIDDSVNKVNTVSSLVGAAGTTMDDEVKRVQKVSATMAEIVSASHAQSTGIQEVNQALLVIDRVTQQNAAMVEEAAAVAHSRQDMCVFKIEGEQGVPHRAI